jgi:hypothetical protein
MNLDSLKYGTLNREQQARLSQPTPFFGCTSSDIPLVAPPLNSSVQTKKELYITQKVMMKSPLHPEFVIQADTDLLSIFEEHLLGLGAETPVWLPELLNQSSSFILHLKNLYQRPRPSQLAAHLDLPFYAESTQSGHSPAYPSGHSAQAILTALSLQKHFRGDHGFMALAQDISLSRLQMGVHYLSDKKYGEFLGYWLFKHCRVHFGY